MKEGGPEVCELLAVMQEEMRLDGPIGDEAADAMMLASDCYLRGGEAFSLKVQDVIIDNSCGEVVIYLAHTKTGAHQGVRIDFPQTERMLKERVRGKRAEAKLFDITAADYRRRWTEVAMRLVSRYATEYPNFCIGPPHSVRHGAAARDATSGYRSIWQIQRRGRWASEKSVMRYAKTWAWTAAMAKTPPALVERGEALLKARGARKPEAKE